MKAKAIKEDSKYDKYTVEIKQGVQAFTLDYSASKKEAEWMASMFNKALRTHDWENVCNYCGRSERTEGMPL